MEGSMWMRKERKWRLSYLAPVTVTLMRETVQSVRFVESRLEKICISAKAVASLFTQVVWRSL